MGRGGGGREAEFGLKGSKKKLAMREC